METTVNMVRWRVPSITLRAQKQDSLARLILLFWTVSVVTCDRTRMIRSFSETIILQCAKKCLEKLQSSPKIVKYYIIFFILGAAALAINQAEVVTFVMCRGVHFLNT